MLCLSMLNLFPSKDNLKNQIKQNFKSHYCSNTILLIDPSGSKNNFVAFCYLIVPLHNICFCLVNLFFLVGEPVNFMKKGLSVFLVLTFLAFQV